MGNFDSNDSHDDALKENDPALWSLLGRARAVEASPWFAGRVLRAIEESPRPVWWQALCRSFGPAAICAGIAIVAVAGIGRTGSAPAVANAEIEFETIQNLDLLVANYESSLWLDPPSP